MDDRNAFLFSLDKKKIYHYKNNGYAIYYSKYDGPRFGYGGNEIRIENHCICEKELYTQYQKKIVVLIMVWIKTLYLKM